MQYLKFYRCNSEKIPIRCIRKEKAFIHPKNPGVFALPVLRQKDFLRKPDAALWNGLDAEEMKLWTYPLIKEQEWFTYKKNGDKKVKRVTLAEYLKGKEE
jgi:hypothetical protein